MNSFNLAAFLLLGIMLAITLENSEAGVIDSIPGAKEIVGLPGVAQFKEIANKALDAMAGALESVPGAGEMIKKAKDAMESMG